MCRLAPALELTKDDEEALATARGLGQALASASMPLDLSPTGLQRLGSEFGPLLPELLPGVLYTGPHLFLTLLTRHHAEQLG